MENNEENEAIPILYAVFDGGGQGQRDVGLMGIFDSEVKALESIGNEWLTLKKVKMNILHRDGIQ